MSSQPPQAGFTLVEILVSVAIFALIVTAAIGAIFAMVDASQKARSMSSAMTNLNIALESMARSIRVGSEYACVSGSPCTTISFLPADSLNGELAQYSFREGQIQICRSDPALGQTGGACTWLPITATDVVIDDLRFHIENTTTKQPYVFMKIKGTVVEREETKTTFNIQTLMTQRLLGTR